MLFIYADLECIIEKIHLQQKWENIPSGFLMSTILPFKSKDNKHDVYRGKDCMKKFCESLKKSYEKVIS